MSGGKPTGHGVGHDVAAEHQVAVEPGHRRQPALDRPGSQPRFTVDEADDLSVTAWLPLLGDESEHVSRHYLARRLGDDPEERLQV